VTPPDVKALLRRAAKARMTGGYGINTPVDHLLNTIEAIPVDAVLVDRAVLVKIQEALDIGTWPDADVANADEQKIHAAIAALDGLLGGKT
jgi:hypothetical protein